MDGWRLAFLHGMNMFSVGLLLCFFAGNLMYTLLIIISFISAYISNRRLTYVAADEVLESTAMPPATIIMPAFNEEAVIVESVRSVLKIPYPGLQIIVVDDGSTDATLKRVIDGFGLTPTEFIYRPRAPSLAPREFYVNPRIPNLLVIRKENGGKADALNVGINLCRTPYFCSLDADCILERDALRRLMGPMVLSAGDTIVSAGVVRILNGCQVKDGQISKIRLPRKLLERFQVVEYLRCFLFGRAGWSLLRGTLIVSGVFALFHRESVLGAGGFPDSTVTEDMDLIMYLQRWAVQHQRRIKIAYTMHSVCWTECPSSLGMLARQRRRWQMGLCQTLWANSEMLLNPKYGLAGMLSFPFHLWVEAGGAVMEFLGYLILPVALFLEILPAPIYVLLLLVSLAYGGLLSLGAVLLEELSQRRYPSSRDLWTLVLLALAENMGYRQLLLYFRFQGVVKFFTRSHKWESIRHTGAAASA